MSINGLKPACYTISGSLVVGIVVHLTIFLSGNHANMCLFGLLSYTAVIGISASDRAGISS